jgi:hypothetical protein
MRFIQEIIFSLQLGREYVVGIARKNDEREIKFKSWYHAWMMYYNLKKI